MKATGNGAPNVCANNLLRLVRGEVPYERVKGLDPQIIGRPVMIGNAQLRQDADWLVETYEPRAVIKSISVDQEEIASGGFTVTAEIEERGNA